MRVLTSSCSFWETSRTEVALRLRTLLECCSVRSFTFWVIEPKTERLPRDQLELSAVVVVNAPSAVIVDEPSMNRPLSTPVPIDAAIDMLVDPAVLSEWEPPA